MEPMPPDQYSQGGYPPPPGPGGYPSLPGSVGTREPPKQLSVLALLAFIFGLIALFPLALILGIVALTRIPRRNEKGKGLAIAGIALAAVWFFGIVAVSTFVRTGGEPDRDASGQVTTSQNTRPDKLRVGDCVTSVTEGEVKDIEVQPCNQPNGGKVFAVFDLPAGEWPGLAAVQAAAEKGCTDRYTASKQQPEKPSDVFFLHPVEDGWALGDRGTTCLLVPR